MEQVEFVHRDDFKMPLLSACQDMDWLEIPPLWTAWRFGYFLDKVVWMSDLIGRRRLWFQDIRQRLP